MEKEKKNPEKVDPGIYHTTVIDDEGVKEIDTYKDSNGHIQSVRVKKKILGIF